MHLHAVFGLLYSVCHCLSVSLAFSSFVRVCGEGEEYDFIQLQ